MKVTTRSLRFNNKENYKKKKGFRNYEEKFKVNKIN